MPEKSTSHAHRKYGAATGSASGLMSEGVIFVRDYGGTHIARFRGKTASSTCGREAAAKAVARKVMGATPHYVDRCGNDYAWQVVSNKITGEI
jgi:hypothetical protein